MRAKWWLIKPRLGVVLSGGATLGAFQVGVIDVMARRGVVPDLRVVSDSKITSRADWERIEHGILGGFDMIGLSGLKIASPIERPLHLNARSDFGMVGDSCTEKAEGPFLGELAQSGEHDGHRRIADGKSTQHIGQPRAAPGLSPN